MRDRETLADVLRDLKRYGKVLLGFVALLWVLEAVSWVLPIDAFGVRPRAPEGLVGILTGPFLHVGITHVFNNSLGLLLFGGLVILREERHLYVTVATSALVGGLGVWLVGGSGSNHIGASGVIFGLFGYLLTTGWFEQKLGSIALSIGVLVVWGGLLFGVLPTDARISWEGHLFGLLGGVLSAWWLARPHRSTRGAAR